MRITRRKIKLLDVNKLLEYAVEETKSIQPEETFLVKDLFKGYEWNRIPRKDRLLLGTLFLNYVNQKELNIMPIEKTSSNQQRYIGRNRGVNK